MKIELTSFFNKDIKCFFCNDSLHLSIFSGFSIVGKIFRKNNKKKIGSCCVKCLMSRKQFNFTESQFIEFLKNGEGFPSFKKYKELKNRNKSSYYYLTHCQRCNLELEEGESIIVMNGWGQFERSKKRYHKTCPVVETLVIDKHENNSYRQIHLTPIKG